MLSIRALLRSSLIVGLGLTVASCGGGGGGNGGGGTPTITSVSVSCSPTSFQTGQSSLCSATVLGTGSFSSAVTWASSSTSVATVDNSGKVTGVSAGTTTITATSAEDATKSGAATISVTSPTITSVSVSCSPTTIQIGATSQCTATVTGTGSFSSVVTWTSSSTATATVDDIGKVAGVGVGTATITATSSQDVTKTGQALIKISEPPPSAAFQPTGPEGSGIGGLAADPTSPGTAYAISYDVGSAGQIWRTTDGAKSWQNISENLVGQMSGNPIAGFVDVKVSSRSGSVYVAIDSGVVIYKSVDHGTAWSAITLPAQQSQNEVYDIALDPLTDSNLYALTANPNVLYGSQDGGTNWSQLSTSCTHNVVADSKTEGTLYCLTGLPYESPGTILTSKDGGRTFTQLASPAPSLAADFLVIAPSDPSEMFVELSQPNISAGFLYRSSDSGVTWTSTGPVFAAGSPVLVDPANALNVFASTTPGYFPTSGVLSSSDGGQTWGASNPVPLPSMGGGPLVMLPGSPPTLLGSWGKLLWSTQDKGLTWSASTQGVSGLFGYAVAVDPKSPQIVYFAASNGGGLYKSTDGGKSWSNTFADSCSSIAVDPFDSNHLVAQCSKLEASRDAGITWQELTVTNGSSSRFLGSTITFDPSSNGIIYLGTSLQNGSTKTIAIVKSLDGGASWSLASSGLPSQGAFVSFGVDPSNPNVLLVGMDSGIYKSSDAGAAWALKAPVLAFSIAFDPSHKGNVYAAGNAAFKSTDSGDSWAQIPVSGANISASFTLVVDPKSADTLFLIPYLGPVGWSADGGNTWFWLSNGLSNTFLPIGGPDSTSTIAGTSPEVLYIPSAAVSLISLELEH